MLRNGSACRRFASLCLPVVLAGMFWFSPVQAAVEFQTFTLKNGMRGIVIPNHKVPAVSHMVWYRVGAGDEQVGQSGVAHFLEHLMFKGTPKVPSGEFTRRIEMLGGDQNAFTSWDFTAYFQKVAREHLATVMEMEADRMRNLQLDPAEVASERKVILEERAVRIGNNPDALLGEQMRAMLFLSHPYHRPIIGWETDIENLSRENALEVYSAAYHPANAILVVGGDVELETVQALAERYYGGIDAGTPLARKWPEEAAPQAARRLTMMHPQVKKPLWNRMWLAPSYRDSAGLPDGMTLVPALQLLEEWLAGGESSPLYQSMVVEQKKASHLSFSYSALALGPSDLEITMLPAEGVTLQEAEAALDATLESLLAKGPDAKALEKARRRLLASLLYSQEGIMSLSYLVGQMAALGIPLEEINRWQERLEAVTPAHVQAAAYAVMQPARSVTGLMLPEGQTQ